MTEITERCSNNESESRIRLFVMCVIHRGVILKSTVAKFRGNDQITRLRPGDTGMQRNISTTFFWTSLELCIFSELSALKSWGPSFVTEFPELSPCSEHCLKDTSDYSIRKQTKGLLGSPSATYYKNSHLIVGLLIRCIRTITTFRTFYVTGTKHPGWKYKPPLLPFDTRPL